MADDDAGADGGGVGSSAPAGVVAVSVVDQSVAAPQPSAPAAPRRAAPAERPVDAVDTTGEQFRKALAWIDQQPNPGQAVIAGVKALQNELNKKQWFKNDEGVYQRALGLRSDDKVTSTKNARLVVAKFLVVYAPFRAAMGADLDAVAILPYGGAVDLAGDDDDDADGAAESVLGWAPFQFGDAGNVSELVQRVGAMIKSLRCDFDLNNSTHKATLGGLVTAHGLTREVGNNRLEVNMDKWLEHGMATFRPAPPRKVSMIDAVARLVMVMRLPALQEELAQLRCGLIRNELDRKGSSTAHLLKSRDSPILKVFYNSSTTFEDPAGMAQETFLSDESLTPNPNQDFSQVDPAKLYEEYNRVKAAIAVPAANWMKSGNNDVPFSNFCNDRPLAYIFHIFKESAKLGPDGRFTEIIPGWFTRELPAQFQASGGLAPEIGATASGARRSRAGAAGLARADLLVQGGVSRERGGRTARKATRSLPSDGGAEGVDAGALVIADAIRFSSAPPETALSYLKGTLECAVMIENSTDPRMQALYGRLLDKAGAAMSMLQPFRKRARSWPEMLGVRVEEFGEPSVLKHAHIAPPTLQSPSQVLVAVSFAAVNPVDCYIRSGAYAAKPALPYTPGKDAAGVVLAVGADVRHVRQGDRVWTYGSISGTYAPVALCEGWHVLPLPDALSDEDGATLGTPFATAYRALFARGRARPGEVVFVHGASGGVGLAAVQLAVRAGCVVIASAGSAEGAELCRRAGATHAVDHTRWAQPGAPLELPSQPALIVEMLANANLARDLAAVAPGGRIVIVGSRGPIEIDPRAAMQKEVDVLGVMLARATPAERDEMGAHVCAGLRAGILRALPRDVLELGAAAEAHERTIARAPGQGRIVLRVPPS